MACELVIFDCDGVLVDSEPIANRVFMEQLRAAGLPLPLEEVMRRFVGGTKESCLALAAKLLGRPLPPGFVESWDAALFAALGSEVKAVAGVADLLRGLKLPYCVASNSSPERMRLSLRTTGLLPLFEGRMFTAGEVPLPKPAPDLFLHAAKSLGAAASRCVVVEDTPTGVRAGVAAGMTVFGYAGGDPSGAAKLAMDGVRVFNAMPELAALLSAAAG